MGQTPPACFSKTNSRNATSKHDTNGRTQSQTMCLNISKKRLKPLAKSSKTKQFGKNLYTILEGPLHEFAIE
jgi:hypothetical protein